MESQTLTDGIWKDKLKKNEEVNLFFTVARRGRCYGPSKCIGEEI